MPLAVLVAVMAVAVWQFEAAKSERRAVAQRAAAEALQMENARRAREQQEERQAEAERKAADEALAVHEQQAKAALKASYVAFANLLNRWQDALRVAGATSRISLSGPVSVMQGLRREAEGQEVPACLNEDKRLLVRSMNSSIESFMLFMTDPKDYQAGKRAGLMEDSAAAMRELAARRAGDCPTL